MFLHLHISSLISTVLYLIKRGYVVTFVIVLRGLLLLFSCLVKEIVDLVSALDTKAHVNFISDFLFYVRPLGSISYACLCIFWSLMWFNKKNILGLLHGVVGFRTDMCFRMVVIYNRWQNCYTMKKNLYLNCQYACLRLILLV